MSWIMVALIIVILLNVGAAAVLGGVMKLIASIFKGIGSIFGGRRY